ncbi:Alkaline shock protein 23 [Fusobacterium sp. DD29]|uniref:Asp23/Gls24 family envelope stress response protein n=1 Tax=unclassified Fusobacterium TaxID=2648384 RepID=UPI001B8B0283|nr:MULTISPECIES: Asp23/Gls24 family envelope stress response protein [unclassified Fusobacterium]MBR8702160.1 Alkaline shock protein 23 [Fusobacterium sp. DD45]MBR8711983.1 Alkaline shock protein 23 [Fusobacterium sp. DD28]MBR8750436.1 Alkaline shock protein 23 [Fusobacterium sp. DD29]MBR8752556.1 Alkaline shock protein 23 [Fusobacterium sp. DD26]MBR8762677.1 Alkaline shock protein 23 [Fusobacterium sp. DD25]
MSELGNIRISDDVVKTIAAKAASDVEGVYKLAGGVADEVSKILGKKRPTNGVKVEVGEKECSIEVFIIVEYGYLISDVAHEIQKSVLKAVSELSGLKVVEVNVYVQDVKIKTEEAPETEGEETEM